LRSLDGTTVSISVRHSEHIAQSLRFGCVSYKCTKLQFIHIANGDIVSPLKLKQQKNHER